MSNPYPLAIYEVKTGRLPGWGYEPIRITIPAHTFDEVFEDLPVDLRISADSGANHATIFRWFYSARLGCGTATHLHHSGDGITPCSVEIKVEYRHPTSVSLTVRCRSSIPVDRTCIIL